MDTTTIATAVAATPNEDMYMIFRIDREYDPDYDTHAEIVSFRGVRHGLSKLFTDPSQSGDLFVREDGSVHACLYHMNRKIEYVAVKLPSEEGLGPDFAIELFESYH